MDTFKNLRDGNKKYLLIPVMPTPNGGLHLGHLSGPYLKMDVLARAQRRNGSEVAMFFGSDGYESYMNLKAWQTGREVEVLCNEYHERMRADLDALAIQYDAFINPLDATYQEDFQIFFTSVVKALTDKGVTEIRPEKYLYSKDEDCFLTGCWIQGTCPGCGTATGSYQCEDCGTQYRPMDLLSPSFKRGDQPQTVINDCDLYLAINKKDELLLHLESMQLGAEFMKIATTYFEQQGNYVRLTNPGKWGIPWQVEGSNVPHVLFTYTALYIYSLFCGELYKKKFNAALNPFDKNSKVITVASFGIDCTIPYVVAGVGLAIESGAYRPFDFLLPNHFFTLEHSKFSTSRGHAIWGNDIIHQTPVSPDAVRYFLVLNNPENAMSDFNVDEFIAFINHQLADELQGTLTKARAFLKEETTAEIDGPLTEKLETLLVQQLAYLTPPAFRLKSSCRPMEEWISIGGQMITDSSTAYWWLKGFALLAFPIMPGCAVSLWNLLGHTGQPAETDYFLQPAIQLTALPVYFSRVGFEEIKPALPATLFVKENK